VLTAISAVAGSYTATFSKPADVIVIRRSDGSHYSSLVIWSTWGSARIRNWPGELPESNEYVKPLSITDWSHLRTGRSLSPFEEGASGFPLRSFRWEFSVPQMKKEAPTWGIEIGSVRQLPGPRARPNQPITGRLSNPVLPYRPVPLLFAMNVLFWGTAAFIFYRVISLFRQIWRVRRGRCPSCAYPIDHEHGQRVCPECGAGFGARSIAIRVNARGGDNARVRDNAHE